MRSGAVLHFSFSYFFFFFSNIDLVLHATIERFLTFITHYAFHGVYCALLILSVSSLIPFLRLPFVRGCLSSKMNFSTAKKVGSRARKKLAEALGALNGGSCNELRI